jgi:hypothetical protein
MQYSYGASRQISLGVDRRDQKLDELPWSLSRPAQLLVRAGMICRAVEAAEDMKYPLHWHGLLSCEPQATPAVYYPVYPFCTVSPELTKLHGCAPLQSAKIYIFVLPSLSFSSGFPILSFSTQNTCISQRIHQCEEYCTDHFIYGPVWKPCLKSYQMACRVQNC